jgi:hypothetical protein
MTQKKEIDHLFASITLCMARDTPNGLMKTTAVLDEDGVPYRPDTVGQFSTSQTITAQVPLTVVDWVPPKGAFEYDEMLKLFKYEHLPSHLQAVSKPFGVLAYWMFSCLPDGRQREEGLQRLLEAKDCAVRAALK